MFPHFECENESEICAWHSEYDTPAILKSSPSFNLIIIIASVMSDVHGARFSAQSAFVILSVPPLKKTNDSETLVDVDSW